MGDYFPGKIEIGGQLAEELVESFVDAIMMDGATIGDDYDDGTPDEGDVDKAVRNVSAEKISIKFCDTEATGGVFENIESFCHNNKLAYVRHSDAKYEYHEEIVYWFPGMTEEESLPCCNEAVVVPVKDLLEVINDDSSHALIRLARLSRMLTKYQLPTVPPIELVGGRK